MEHFIKQSECFYSSAQTKLGDSTLHIHKDLVKVEGSKASSHATIRRWHGLFCSKNKSKESATSLGHPKNGLG